MNANFARKLIDFRRDLHQHPECGWTEYYTTVRIVRTLQDAGIPVQFGNVIHSVPDMHGMPSQEADDKAWHNAMELTNHDPLLNEIRHGFTGCVAKIEGVLPGKTTVFRVDIDACELEECHEVSHTPAKLGFDSKHRGLMHACGHDAHTAIGVGLAILLQQKCHLLRGTVYVVFQPAEEGLRGAASLVKTGLLDDCDRLIGLHVGIKDLPFGTVATSAEGFLSSTKMDIFFHGKAAHAGICPEQGRNALAAAAKATLELLDLPIQHEGVCRVNVGTFHAGSGRNVIPSQAHLAIETRADTALRNKMLAKEAEAVCDRAAATYGCTYSLQYMGGSNAAVCDADLSEAITKLLQNMPQIKNILPSISFGGGEDVTTLMQCVQDHGGKATELLLGIPLIAPHHSERFDIDERVISLGVEVLYRIAIELM